MNKDEENHSLGRPLFWIPLWDVMSGRATEGYLKERRAQLLLIIMPFKSLMACQMRVVFIYCVSAAE